MIFSNGNNMMNFQLYSGATAFIIMVATLLTSPFVTCHDTFGKGSKGGGIIDASFATFPVAMFFARCKSIFIIFFSKTFIPRDLPFFTFKPFFTKFRVVFESFVNMAPVAVRNVSWLISHTFKNWTRFFSKAFVPTLSIKSAFLTFRMVSSYIKRNIKRCTFFTYYCVIESKIFNDLLVFINWKRIKGFATTAGTNSMKFFVLSFRSSHTVPYTHKQERSQGKSGEFRGYPNVKPRTILSQASQGIDCEEGATTMRVSPNNNPSHERPTQRKGRDSLNCMDNMQNNGLNGHWITNLNSVPFSGKLDNLSEHPVDIGRIAMVM